MQKICPSSSLNHTWRALFAISPILSQSNNCFFVPFSEPASIAPESSTPAGRGGIAQRALLAFTKARPCRNVGSDRHGVSGGAGCPPENGRYAPHSHALHYHSFRSVKASGTDDRDVPIPYCAASRPLSGLPRPIRLGPAAETFVYEYGRGATPGTGSIQTETGGQHVLDGFLVLAVFMIGHHDSTVGCLGYAGVADVPIHRI